MSNSHRSEGSTVSNTNIEETIRLARELHEQEQLAKQRFITPRFPRRDVARALNAKETTFQNWQARKNLTLDADEMREGSAWRLYSGRDVLRLGLAVKLTSLGFPAALLDHVMKQVDPIFSGGSHYLSSNRASHILVSADGAVSGPNLGENIDLEEIEDTSFIVVRLDRLIQDSLENLGASITSGSAEDMAEAAARMRAKKGQV